MTSQFIVRVDGQDYLAKNGAIIDDTGTLINEANFIRATYRALVWEPTHQSDTGANDSDKTFTVTALRQWRVRSISIDFKTLSSTGVAGSTGARQIEVQFLATDTSTGFGRVLARVVAGAVQLGGSSGLGRLYLGSPDLEQQTAFVDTNKLTFKIPDIVLGPNQQIRIFDNNAIRSTADDLVVDMVIDERVVPST